MESESPIEVAGKRIVFAGAMSMSRAELQTQLEARGAIVESKVSRVTDLVVKGDGGTPTLFAAKEKGVRVVEEAALLAAVGIELDAGPSAAEHAPIDPAALQGAEVVITGRLAEVDRNEAAARLGLLGAKVVTTVTAATKLVFAGDKAGANLFHAKEQGAEVVDEAALIAVLEQAPELRELSEEERREAELEAARARAAELIPTLGGAEVVISRGLHRLDRNNAVKRLVHAGARIADRVTRATKLLVAGEARGPNYFLAKQQHVDIVDETVLAMIHAQLPPAPDETAEADAPGDGDGPPQVEGKRVLLAGTFPRIDRVRAKRGLERGGAEVVTKMDASVQLVVYGEKGGRNLFLAKELGTPLLDEDGLLPLLERIDAEHPDRGDADDAPVELAGARVVLAGGFETLGRVEAKRALARLGAEVADEVDESVQYVVAGEHGGRNLLLAKMLDKPTLDEATFVELLQKAGALAGEDDDGSQTAVELSGATVALTGCFGELTRADVAARLVERGATVVPGVVPGIDYLIAGSGANPTQRLQARRLKIPELGESELSRFLGR